MIDFRVALLLALTVKLSLSCLASGNNNGGDVAANACTTCTTPAISTRAPVLPTPGTLTQTVGTNSAGCTTITSTCAGGANAALLEWIYQQQTVAFSSSSTTMTTSNPATATLTCNSNGKLVLSQADGDSEIVDAVTCSVA